jgi:phage terminase large subunit-like protein
MQRFHEYVEGITTGRITSGEFVKMAVERHTRDVLRTDLYFDEDAAQHALDFFQFVTLYKGEKAGMGITLEPFQVFIIGSIFGWKWSLTSLRRFNRAYVEVARKNGKTTLAAGIALYMLIADEEGGAEVYMAATTKEQANICFKDAREITLRSRFLSSRVTTLAHSIYAMASASILRALSSDTETLDGKNPHLVVLDEIHAYKTSSLYDIFSSALGNRLQALILMITTAGFNKTFWCYSSQRKFIARILRQEIDNDDNFGIIYTLDKDDDFTDPTVWIKANPGMGALVSVKYLAAQVKEALSKASALVGVKTKNFNMWVDAATEWIPSETWRGLYLAPESLPDLRKCMAYGGVDLSWIRDICAYTLRFTLPSGGTYVKHKFFVPMDGAREREEATGIPYAEWMREGHLIGTPGNTIDYNVVMKHIIDDFAMYDIHTIGFDRANSSHIMQEINDVIPPRVFPYEGKMVRVNAVYGISPSVRTMSNPTKEFERAVCADKKEFFHDGNPIMTWMVSNVVIKYDGEGYCRPDKAKSQEKIDGVMSTLLSIEQSLFWGASSKKVSKYENSDIVTV